MAPVRWVYWVTIVPEREARYERDFEGWLDGHGAEGWELVSIESRETSHDGLGRIVFKRVKSDG